MEAFLSWLLQTMSWYDREESVSWPTGNIDVVAASNLRCHEDLCGVFSVLSGPHAIAEYCALVAAGLEGRPRDKFNPCSARDAHIMLQMKRIFEASAAPQDTGQGGALALPPPCRKKISCIFRCALEVGKAVRNPDCLTQIEALRGFGEGGRYSRQPPRRLAREAADVAWSSIIKPTVVKQRGNPQRLDASGTWTDSPTASGSPGLEPTSRKRCGLLLNCIHGVMMSHIRCSREPAGYCMLPHWRSRLETW